MFSIDNYVLVTMFGGPMHVIFNDFENTMFKVIYSPEGDCLSYMFASDIFGTDENEEEEKYMFDLDIE